MILVDDFEYIKNSDYYEDYKNTSDENDDDNNNTNTNTNNNTSTKNNLISYYLLIIELTVFVFLIIGI